MEADEKTHSQALTELSELWESCWRKGRGIESGGSRSWRGNHRDNWPELWFPIFLFTNKMWCCHMTRVQTHISSSEPLQSDRGVTLELGSLAWLLEPGLSYDRLQPWTPCTLKVAAAWVSSLSSLKPTVLTMPRALDLPSVLMDSIRLLPSISQSLLASACSPVGQG